MSRNKITIIGAGSWGLSIANLIAENGKEVFVYVKENLVTDEINNKHTSSKLPKIRLSNQIIATHNFEKAVTGSKFLFIVTPSIVVTEVVKKIAKNKIAKDAILVVCSKGIEDKNSKLFSQIIKEILPNNSLVILSGPNFASEVAAKLPTVTTIASKNKNAANKIISLLKNNYFLPIYSADVITTQVCGAIKNILAIGCGIIEGLKLGENAKAALIISGINEINLLSGKLGGKPESLLSPAGFGDLFLTCSSKKSRNNSLGILIGQGKNSEEILSDKNKIYEGARSAKSISTLANKYKITLPICQAINNILYKNPKQNIQEIIHQSIFFKQ